jgi:hypothetical protein
MLRMPPQLQMPHHVPKSFQPMAPSTSCASGTATSERPKLCLNTEINNTKTRTFGKGSSLRIDTLSVVTPTTINTYSNAYHHETKEPGQETPAEQPSAVSSTSTSSTASLEAASICPYNQHSHVKSVLSNSHFVRITARGMSSQKSFFPPRKNVSFKEPLSEEISTVKFIFAHSDIEELIPLPGEIMDFTITNSAAPAPAPLSLAPITNTSQTLPPVLISPPELQMPTAPTDPTQAPTKLRIGSPSTSPRLLRRLSPVVSPSTIGHKRDSSTDSEADESCPQTPVAGRSKRRRWQWTLGPLPGYKGAELGDDDTTPQGSREGSVMGDEVLMSPDA